MPLVLTLTTPGIAAIIDAEANGFAPVVITEVGISETHTPVTDATNVLVGELKRLSVSGAVIAPDTIHVMISDATTDTYNWRALALYLDDGTLLAAYSQAGVLLVKSAPTQMMTSIDAKLSSISAESLTFGDVIFVNPPATTEIKGVVERATQAEALGGVDTERYVSPADLAAAIAANPHATLLGEGKWLHRVVADTDYYKFPKGADLPLPQYQPLFDLLTGDPNMAVDAVDKLANPSKWGPGDGATYFTMPDLRGQFTRIWKDDLAAGGVTRPGLGVRKANQNAEHDHAFPPGGQNTSVDQWSGGSGAGGPGGIRTQASGGDEAVPDHTALYYIIRVL